MLQSRCLPCSPCKPVHRASQSTWFPPTLHTQNSWQTRPVLGGEQAQEAERSDLHLPRPIILQISDMEGITAGERFDLIEPIHVWTCYIAFHHHHYYYYMTLHHQIFRDQPNNYMQMREYHVPQCFWPFKWHLDTILTNFQLNRNIQRGRSGLHHPLCGSMEAAELHTDMVLHQRTQVLNHLHLWQPHTAELQRLEGEGATGDPQGSRRRRLTAATQTAESRAHWNLHLHPLCSPDQTRGSYESQHHTKAWWEHVIPCKPPLLTCTKFLTLKMKLKSQTTVFSFLKKHSSDSETQNTLYASISDFHKYIHRLSSRHFIKYNLIIFKMTNKINMMELNKKALKSLTLPLLSEWFRVSLR